MTPLLVLTLALAAPVPKAPVKAEAKFDGVWILKARESRGKETPLTASVKSTHTLVIAGNDFYFRNFAGTVKLDAEKKTLDMAVTAGLYKGESTGGVFERTDDTLKVALPITPRTTAVRPTELKTVPGVSGYLYTFERDKDAKAADVLKEKVAALPAAGANPFNPGVPVAPPPFPLPARPNAAQQFQDALERIEKLEKRIQELEKAQVKKDERK